MALVLFMILPTLLLTVQLPGLGLRDLCREI